MAERERIGLVGCVRTKRAAAAPARDLYNSDLFAKRRRHVERTCDRWLILSALHGLVDPAAMLAPSDATLKNAPTSRKREWSQLVLVQLRGRLGDLGRLQFEIHAGADYDGHGLADGLRAARAAVATPTAGLAIGRQKAFYNDAAATGPAPARVPPRRAGAAPRERMDTSDFAAVWSAIERHAGQTFRQARGQEFTYAVRGNAITPSTTSARIARPQLERAWRRLPVAGSGELSDLFAPSYLYAILMDPRLRK